MIRKNSINYDVIVIGGGFYGCMIALFLKNYFSKILIIEKENDILTKASYNNQARIHNGYHYPRSFLTALRSHLNYQRFIRDFSNTVTDSHMMTYAIASNTSKVTTYQFLKICKQIGASLQEAPTNIKNLFNDRLIENVFLVEEGVFNAAILRDTLKKKLQEAKIEVFYQREVDTVVSHKNNLILGLKDGEELCTTYAYNCTYANLNEILKNSHLPLLPLKYEIAEMPLVTLPDPFSQMSVTIMDGAFFSLMPFPDKHMHSLHHVRYTPHSSWTDFSDEMPELQVEKSKYIYMYKDIIRYIPLLEKMEYKDSLFEKKTILVQSEENDGRPILYRRDYGLKNFSVVLGGKIDNIYDIFEEIRNNIK